jgi:hypothetical protein
VEETVGQMPLRMVLTEPKILAVVVVVAIQKIHLDHPLERTEVLVGLESSYSECQPPSRYPHPI